MADTTTVMALPYPEGSDANDVPADVQALAERLDEAPGIESLTSAQIAALTAGQKPAGRVVYNSTTSKLQVSNGSTFANIDAAALLLAGGTMAGNIAMGSNKVTGLAAASSNGDAVRYEQALLLAGGTMTGKITLDGNPSSALHAATKDYVDDAAETAFGAWQTHSVNMKNADGVTAFSGATEEYKYIQVGKLVILRGNVQTTSGLTYAGTAERRWKLALPVQIKNTSAFYGVPLGQWSSLSWGNSAGYTRLRGEIFNYAVSDWSNIGFTYYGPHNTATYGSAAFDVGYPGLADYAGGVIRPGTGDIIFGFQIVYEAV